MQSKDKPAFNKALLPILLIQLIGSMGYGIIFPIMPYYAAQFEANPLTVGLLSASYAVCSLLAGPILGQLSDRYGRRPWLLFSQLGTVLGFVLFGIGGSLWMLFLGRIVDGISGGNIVIAQAYVSDVTKPEDRTRVFGLMGAAFGLGFVLGPIIGSLLSPFGFAVPSFAAAGMALIAAITTFFMLPESVKQSGAPTKRQTVIEQFAAIGQVLRRPELRTMLTLFAAMTMTMALFVTTIGQFMQLQIKAPASQSGYPAAAFGLFNILFQVLLVGRMVKSLGERRMIPIGFAALFVANLGLFFVSTLWFTIALGGFLAFGMTLLRPSLTALISQRVGAHEQGKVLGVNQSIDSLAQVIAPILGGWLIGTFTPGTPGLLAAGLAAMALVIFFGVRASLPERAMAGPMKPATAAK